MVAPLRGIRWQPRMSAPLRGMAAPLRARSVCILRGTAGDVIVAPSGTGQNALSLYEQPRSCVAADGSTCEIVSAP
jgi:hypothetical protein